MTTPPPAEPTKQRLTDKAGACKMLDITERHLRKLMEGRRISYVKVGRSVRFEIAYLERYIKANTIEAEAS